MGTWEHRAITPVCSQCVPSVFPVCGNTKQGGKWRSKGLYREKTKCVPNVLTFFLYIALRAFFFSLSLYVYHLFFFLLKFYFFVGTVGTVGTWRQDAIGVGTFFGFLGTRSGNMGTLSGNIEWEHGNIIFRANLSSLKFEKDICSSSAVSTSLVMFTSAFHFVKRYSLEC